MSKAKSFINKYELFTAIVFFLIGFARYFTGGGLLLFLLLTFVIFSNITFIIYLTETKQDAGNSLLKFIKFLYKNLLLLSVVFVASNYEGKFIVMGVAYLVTLVFMLMSFPKNLFPKEKPLSLFYFIVTALLNLTFMVFVY